MIVSLIREKSLYMLSLPEKVSGKYWVTDRDDQGRTRKAADIEGLQGRWTLHGSKALLLTGPGDLRDGTIALTEEIQVIKARYTREQEEARFYIEPSTADRQCFQKYQVPEACRLDIGRTDGNQILYDNRYVSAHHACLIWQDGQWSITDTQSGNGTFVNGERIAMRQLQPGDMVWIMGLEIVVGNGFFALNDPDGKVQIKAGQVVPLARQEPKRQETGGEEVPKQTPFAPAPVLHRQIERETVRVDAPPTPQKPDETPLPLLLGPALTMGMTAVVMASVALNNYYAGTATLTATVPTLIMSFSMLCGTLLWPLLTKRHEKKKKQKLERQRQQRYEEYLNALRGKIFSIGSAQKELLLENYPDCSQCAAWAIARTPGLWERSWGQPDFLSLRLGRGAVPIDAELHFPEERFSIEEDPLQNAVQRLANEPKMIRDAPVVCSIDGHAILGIVGEAGETDRFLRSLVIQMAALHSPKDLKLIFINEDPMASLWDRFRLLPHAWDADGQVHYWICNAEDGKALSPALEKLLFGEAVESSGADHRDEGPSYVFVVSSPALAGQIPVFQQVLSQSPDHCACVIRQTDVAQLPKECTMVIELDGEQGKLISREGRADPQRSFVPEMLTQTEVAQVIDALANIAVDGAGERYMLPNMLTFLEMYGIGKVEHLNALTRWHDNNPVNTLQAPIGVDGEGNIFYLDLHEKYHGPHGLVAGMTGSGKSEFIITYILSMAVNFHPDEVSFILIDYKGGGLAGAFEDRLTGIRLPHLAGTITNLDGSAVNRALISIQSELRRRQAIFNEARNVSGEGTIDIYKYQKMYRNGLVKEPVPHLFIISDEFAELKAQQPEFMAQLISTARIGRSLGVHLILATQKPSGVVDDQIWSNSRFRVCLKVQERADSMEMLKRPDAAQLSDTGRFYLQVGFNELFELGQSAWCGAPYIPADKAEKKRDDSVEILDKIGQVLAVAKPKAAKGDSGGKSQIVSIVEYLSGLAKGEHIGARQLWLPPIPATIYLDELRGKYGWQADPLALDPIIGEYDDPFNQAKGLLTLPLTQTGNAILYGATGSGKGMVLDTLLCGLLQSYDPSRLNIYLIDLGEETLRSYECAPQVGGVMLASDGERIHDLFKMLGEEVTARKKKFSDAGGSYADHSRISAEPAPHILVLIRDYAAFGEQFEDLDDYLVRLARDCFKYGIYFLLTANSANAVRYRLAQSFPNILCLQMNDRSDYVGLFGRTEGVYPSAIKGRGIFRSDRVYEFQGATFATDPSVQTIRALSKHLQASSPLRARPVPHLPEWVTVDGFPDEPLLSNVPVGVERTSLKVATLDMEQCVFSLVAGQDMAEIGFVAQGIAEQLERLGGSITVLDGAQVFTEPKEMTYSYLRASFQNRIERLFQEMVYRNNTYKAALREGNAPPHFEPEHYVMTGLGAILSGLDEIGRDKLTTLMAKAETAYGIRFVLCETDRALRQMSSDGWYKKHITGSEGIWVGDGLGDQYTFKLGRLGSAFYSEVPPCFGYVVHRGKAVLTKLLVSRWTEEAQENG